MTVEDAWLTATWRFVRGQLPDPPAAVLEIGCVPLGGFVPALLADGYDTIGVDPAAPDAPPYRRSTFEEVEPPGPFNAVIASTSLHHVESVDDVLDRIDVVWCPAAPWWSRSGHGNALMKQPLSGVSRDSGPMTETT